MKAYQFISALDEANEGEIATAPSHAPTNSAGYKTPSSGKSKDEGERTGGEKNAIKKSDHAIPAPIAKAPSHNPTSSAGYKTTGIGKSEDEGEKISKEAMKENLIHSLIGDNEATDVSAIMREIGLAEGGHKPGCTCGFCKNKGKFGKKKDEAEGEPDEKPMDEAIPMRRPMARPGMNAGARPPMGGARPRMPGKAPLGSKSPMDGAGSGRMGFRHPSATRPKANMAPYQPSMESRSIKQLADRYLPSPDR